MSTHTFKNAAFSAKYICDDINALIRSLNFHIELKEADILPMHIKELKFSKENYRPVSILPNISEVYERCLYDHCLLLMIEKWKKNGLWRCL